MQSIHRAICGGVGALALLSGCNFVTSDSTSSGSTSGVSATTTTSSSGTATAPQVGLNSSTGTVPATDSVRATSSVSGTVSTIAGASRTITVAFTSVDGRPISGLALSNTTLPANWSGPTDFTCSATGSGSNCVLVLTYSPTAAETGSLSIGYTFLGDKTPPPGASLVIPYAGTTTNNVVATPAPIGQIDAVAGSGNQTVSVNFTTDDGNAATALTVPTLAALPAGWSTTTPAFSCDIISNGSGCQLVLNYQPKMAGSGTLTLDYGYTDASGTARAGALNLPYATTANGNVVATVSPTGQINAVQKTGRQTATVTFTTDDGETVRNLVLISPLKSLPVGWTSPAGNFTCGTVSTGSGCQLSLAFAPTALTSGTITLDFGYTSPSGTFTTGTVNIPYAATTNNNVVATAAPSGQIDAIVGEVSPTITVTFTTDDMRTATALQLTTDLAGLPTGWSSTDTAFSCAGVDGTTACQLPLTYAPTAAATGTVTLRYTYLNNAGQTKSGSLNIPYRATTDDTIAGTPSSTSLAVLTGTTNPVTVTFATSDGNPASALTLTSGLTPLPAGWTSTATTFTCATVSAGTPCQLPLSYQPTAVGSGTLTLGFTYLNDAGQSKTGTVSSAYRAMTDDTVAGTPSVSPVSAQVGTSTVVTLAFATSDANPASGLSVTSGLTSLPTGWSSMGSTFSCATVSAGTVCQLTLDYLPTAPDSGTVTLGFAYTNDAGTMKTGTVSVPYTASP